MPLLIGMTHGLNVHSPLVLGYMVIIIWASRFYYIPPGRIKTMIRPGGPPGQMKVLIRPADNFTFFKESIFEVNLAILWTRTKLKIWLDGEFSGQ